ncbi:MAG: hypothetical protein KKH72_12275 [Alphaproteobacteria bacterium]|nr:hypothetical protein [Alphaproteobacteria bacterium]
MTDHKFDIAITGTSAFAALLALTLARRHQKHVCLIGQLPAPLQVLRDITLAVGPFSRPETLRLVASAVADLRKFLPPSVFERRDVVFVARGAEGRAATGHVRQMLMGMGVPTTLPPLGSGPRGFVAEGILALRPSAFHAGLPDWLAAAEVRVFAAVEDLQVGHDIVRFAAGHDFVSAGRILVTDGASASCLGTLPDGVVAGWRTAMLTEPVPELADKLIVDAETNGFVVGRADGRLEALAPSQKPEDAGTWLGEMLPPGTTARVIARQRFPVLLSSDGAPVVAPVAGKAAMVATGFGVGGGVLAPALAGHLAGASNSAQAGWFEARTAGKKRAAVAEIGCVGGGAP